MVLKNFATVVLGNGASRSIALLSFIILVRALTEVDLGIYSVLITVMMFTSELMSPVDSYFVSQSGDKDYVKKNINIYFKIKLLYILFMVMAGIIISYFVSIYLIKDLSKFIYVYLFVVFGGVMSVITCYASMHQANNNFISFTVINSIYNLVICAALASVYLVLSVCTLHIISYIYLLTIGFFAILYSFKINLASRVVASYHEAFCKLKTFKSLIGSSVVRLLSNRIDLIIIAYLLTTTDVASYSVASRVSSVSMLFIGNIMSITLVRSSKAIESRNEFVKYIKENLPLLLIITTVIIIMIVLSQQIITVIAGKKYLGSYKIANIMLFQALLNGIASPFISLIYSMKNTRDLLKLEMLKTLYAIVGVVILLNLYGLIGAALGLMIASLINMLSIIFIVIKYIYKTDGYEAT